MAGGRAAARLERAPLLGGVVSAAALRDAEEGLMRGGAESLTSDRPSSFGNTIASGSVREGGLVDGDWRDAESRRRRGDARAQLRRLVGLGAVASTALLALATRADVATVTSAIELGDARITDGGAWGFGADGTVGASAVGLSWLTTRDASRDDARSAGEVVRHDASDAPEWVRRVAPFDEVRSAQEKTFDPVIDWTNEEVEQSWPLFGSEGELKVKGLDRRTARVERTAAAMGVAETSDASDDADETDSRTDFANMTPEQRRAVRIARRVEHRAEAEAMRAAQTKDARVETPLLEPLTSISSLAQPARSRDWRNPSGFRTTFSVNVCGVPPTVRAKQAPWPACRVLLVGCPGGRSAPDADLNKPACASWDVARALEMTPEDVTTNSLSVFSVTTDLYGPGDEFAFALVKPGCTDAQIANALRAQGGAGVSDGSELSLGIDNGGCEVRLDSGFPMGNQLVHPGSRDARCWTPNDATTDIQRVKGDALCESVLSEVPGVAQGVGSSSAAVTASALGSRSVPSPFAARGDTCLLRRDAAYARGKFHRVVPAFEANLDGLGSAVKSPSGDENKVSFVWGTCDAKPRSDSWCAAPAFDAARVAAACGAEYRAPKPSVEAGLGTVERKEAKEAKDSTKRQKQTDVVLNAKPRVKMTREDKSARFASRAAAEILRSKSEPLLSDDAATRVETALARKEAEGRVAALTVAGESQSTHVREFADGAPESNGVDLFGGDAKTNSASVRVVAPGAWSETPATRLVFEDDAPHAVAHLLLRDGDARFASERLPWAELVVNGEVVRAPKQLARGDVVVLRVRAETEAEAEERRASLLQDEGHEETGPVRVATLVVGGRFGSLRARVARGDERTRDVTRSTPPSPREVLPATPPPLLDASPEEAVAEEEQKEEKHKVSHMTLDGAAPGTTAHSLTVTAPRAGQWMVLPPVDAPAVVVSGLGEGVSAVVTVRFAEEEDDDFKPGGEDASVALGSDRRVAPGGEKNGVFAKINGRDEAVESRRDRVVSVWTREETMQIARGGALGSQSGKSAKADEKSADTRSSVTVKDGDKLRVKVRAGPSGAGHGGTTPPVRLAVFVGDHRVGTASVATAATADEAEAAGAALDGRLREAKKEALYEARREAAQVGAAAEVVPEEEEVASSSAVSEEAPSDNASSESSDSAPSLVSLITGREITAEEMRAAPSGATRVVPAGSKVSLPSAGFLTVAGVLPSAELTLLVHAYEQSAGKEIERRAFVDEAKASEESSSSSSSLGEETGDDDAWRTARASLGTEESDGLVWEDSSSSSSSLGASAGSGRLPDWLEVRVEGAAVTPPVPVWLARRISVKLTAAPEAGVARRVVLRAGEQTWQVTVVSEGEAAGSLSNDASKVTESSTPKEVVTVVNGLRDDVQTTTEHDFFVDGDQDARLDSLEAKNAEEDKDESTQDARVDRLETQVEELLETVDKAEEEDDDNEDDDGSISETTNAEEEDLPTNSSDESSDVGASEDPSPTRPSETAWLEGSPVDTLTHVALSDEVVVEVASGDSLDSSEEIIQRVAARRRAVSRPRNHTVSAKAGAVVIAPTPFSRDADAVSSVLLTFAGDIAENATLDVSPATLSDGGAGETVRGLGPDGTCRLTFVAADETGATFTPLSPRDKPPPWSRLIVNGAFVSTEGEETSSDATDEKSLTLRDGDVVAVALVAGQRAGDKRTIVALCVATDPRFPAEEVLDDPAYADDLAANGDDSTEEEMASEYAAPGDAVLVFAATATTKPTTLSPPPPSPPPFPPAAATLASFASAGVNRVPVCDDAGLKRRELSKRLIFDREKALPNEYDVTNAKPNLCGATRPVCANRADPNADVSFPDELKTSSELGSAPLTSSSSVNDRDVVFIVDVSDAVTREAFDKKLTELLLTLFCASHEGSESQAGVVLYPARGGKSAETCGAYEVAIPLARYTTQEWFDAVEGLRNDPDACCGVGVGTTGTAPLAEALDGAGLEFASRGAHDPKKRLAVVVSAGTPAPAVKDESCSETSSEAFSSMTRTFPFNEAKSDGGVVNACTYAWKYVPAAARRLELVGARVAAINVAGDSGSDRVESVLTTAFGNTPMPSSDSGDDSAEDSSFRESWRGAAGAAHFLGAPWPGACGADGHCALSAQYGGSLGRWVYARSDESINSGSETEKVSGSKGSVPNFRYDPGELKTCSFDVPSDLDGRSAISVVSEPHAAHLATIHEWRDMNAVARTVSRLMCEPSTPHVCKTEEDDGVGVAVSQCRGAAVPSPSTRDDTTACLRGLVMAACGRVNLGDANLDASKKCHVDGRLLRDADASDAGLVYGVLACNEVCVGDEDGTETVDAFGRVEVDVTCAPGEACAAGEVRRYTAGPPADARRKQSSLEHSEEGLFPDLDVVTIVAEATPPPPALDSSQGYGIHGK